jgi:hypothetical protein
MPFLAWKRVKLGTDGVRRVCAARRFASPMPHESTGSTNTTERF